MLLFAAVLVAPERNLAEMPNSVQTDCLNANCNSAGLPADTRVACVVHKSNLDVELVIECQIVIK